jgi:hypothetical protein
MTTRTTTYEVTALDVTIMARRRVYVIRSTTAEDALAEADARARYEGAAFDLANWHATEVH